MKKLFLIPFIAFAFNASAQIATKSIGIDSVTGLQQNVVVWQLTIDSKAEKITAVYQIQTVAPNGTVVHTSDNETYTRYNQPERLDVKGNVVAPKKFMYDVLKTSAVGQMIAGMIQADLDKWPNLQQ